MKKLFFLAFTILGLSASSAFGQFNKQQKELLTLGGNAHKSTLSIPQVIDYPMLIVNNEHTHVAGFELSIRSEDGKKVAGPFVSQTGKFAPEMIAALEEFKNMKSILSIQHVMLIKEGKHLKEEALEFNID
jgi:hypothetical protein